VDLLVLKFSHRVLCKLCPVVVAILNFRSTKKTHKTLEVYPLIILTVNISIFSSETIGPFGTKLGRNIPWVDLYSGSNLKHGHQGQLYVLIGWNFKELLWNHFYLLPLLVDLLVLKFSHRVLCKLCPVVVAILNFRSTKKPHKTL
jgi:hypothetical protein